MAIRHCCFYPFRETPCYIHQTTITRLPKKRSSNANTYYVVLWTPKKCVFTNLFTCFQFLLLDHALTFGFCSLCTIKTQNWIITGSLTCEFHNATCLEFTSRTDEKSYLMGNIFVFLRNFLRFIRKGVQVLDVLNYVTMNHIHLRWHSEKSDYVINGAFMHESYNAECLFQRIGLTNTFSNVPYK